MMLLELNLLDIGVCLPLISKTEDISTCYNVHEISSHSAIIATVEKSSLTSCSASSTVSKGKFNNLCIRFCKDFNHFMDDWKPDATDIHLMNLCMVSQGLYNVCSQTDRAGKREASSNAKWFLNIAWEMTGVDVHLDVNIGKHMSSLFHTLTSITGTEHTEQPGLTIMDDVSECSSIGDDILMCEEFDLPQFLYNPTIRKQEMAKLLEAEINEQTRLIDDLRKLGASEATVTTEVKKLFELQNIASSNFRQELVQKIRRQKSSKSSTIVNTKSECVESASSDLLVSSSMRSTNVTSGDLTVMSAINSEIISMHSDAESSILTDTRQSEVHQQQQQSQQQVDGQNSVEEPLDPGDAGFRLHQQWQVHPVRR